MNLILLSQDEIVDEQVILNDNRHLHILNILKSKPEDKVKVGVLGSKTGTATVVQTLEDQTIIKIDDLSIDTPEPSPVTLILAMQRPKMLKRMLRTIAQMGVKDIHLINSSHVEKSYWGTPILNERKYEEYFQQGLEQSLDTIMPTLTLHKQFKPFIEDFVPQLSKGLPSIVMHPNTENDFITNKHKCLLAMGPERGFTNYEIQKFNDIGFSTCKLGKRPLRSEVFLPAVLGHYL